MTEPLNRCRYCGDEIPEGMYFCSSDHQEEFYRTADDVPRPVLDDDLEEDDEYQD